MVLEGRLRVTLDGEEHVLTRGDTASIPAGTEHAYSGDGHYTKVLTMSTPGGLERLIATAGAATEEHIFGAEPARSTSTRCARPPPSSTSPSPEGRAAARRSSSTTRSPSAATVALCGDAARDDRHLAGAQ